MSGPSQFILGEYRRTLDDRYRLTIPAQLSEPLTAPSPECILAKERPGCLSLWNAADWKARWEGGVELIRQKMQLGRLEGQIAQVQRLGRLLSSRHTSVQLAQRSRLLVPEGFREFLKVEPNGEVMVVGAAVCVEIWNPVEWLTHLESQMPKFGRLFNRLVR